MQYDFKGTKKNIESTKDNARANIDALNVIRSSGRVPSDASQKELNQTLSALQALVTAFGEELSDVLVCQTLLD